LEETYGNREWNVQTFSDTASGTDSDRAEFNRLKTEILADKIDVVITEKISKISRDMGQFVEFMRLCNEKNVEVLCMDGTDAQRILEMPAI
jgi:DNA invertase Pin-like site-specific DNA recombinase